MTHFMELAEPRTLRIPTWTLADRLRKARESTGLGQSDFADFSGISRTSVVNYESGKRTPKGLYLKAWAGACGVPAEWLVTGNAPAEAGAHTCDMEPPVGLEPTTCSLQGCGIPDTAAELLALWAVSAR